MKWYREPLLHFLLIGAALFVLYSALNDDRGSSPQRIEITASDIERLKFVWQAQWNRSPTASELDHLIENEIRQEVLYQEAVAMGLDRDDVIIKRRLAQKIEFLADDLTKLREPTREELQAFLEENKGRFAQPPLISFHHIYLSPDKRGENVLRDSQKVLSLLHTKGNDDVEKYEKLGDPIMLQYQYDVQTPYEVEGSFGSKFADEVFKLPTQSWQGPIESGYGFDLIWIDSRTEPHAPLLEEVKSEVVQAWQPEQREKAKQELFERMKSRYEIVVDKNDSSQPLAVTVSTEGQRNDKGEGHCWGVHCRRIDASSYICVRS